MATRSTVFKQTMYMMMQVEKLFVNVYMSTNIASQGIGVFLNNSLLGTEICCAALCTVCKYYIKYHVPFCFQIIQTFF